MGSVAMSCNFIAPDSGSSGPSDQGDTNVSTALKVPACGPILRELIKNKYKDEADPSAKLDQDLDSSSGIGFDTSSLTTPQKNCLAELKDGDFLSSVETSLKYYEALERTQVGQYGQYWVSDCRNGSLINASVETSLKYAEACGYTLPSGLTNPYDQGWREKAKVLSSVETYLKFAEAIRDVSADKHKVLASVETYLKFGEATRITSLNNINTVLSSVETYLKFAEAMNIWGASYQVQAPLMRTHIPVENTLAKLNEAFGSAGSFTLGSDLNLLNSIGSLTETCNGDAFDTQRINEKGIILLKSTFWGTGKSSLLAKLAFPYSSDSCGQSNSGGSAGPAVPALTARNLYAEDFDRLLDKGVVMQNDFSTSFIGEIGYGGARMLDKGIVFNKNFKSIDEGLITRYFLLGKEVKRVACDYATYNYETSECVDFYDDTVTTEEQVDRLADKGFVALDVAGAALMNFILIGDSANYPTDAKYSEQIYTEAIDRVLDKGTVGTSKAPVIGSMFVDKELFGPYFYDRVIDRGVYFDGEKFLSIEAYLKQREAAQLPK